MARQIPGDPLTGQLPRTQLVIAPERVLGPAPRGPEQAQWPRIAEPLAVTYSRLAPGRVASVRTRWGVRSMLVRVVRASREMGPNRGRHYVVGMNRKGRCWSAWVDRVISVESVERALMMQRAIGPGKKEMT